MPEVGDHYIGAEILLPRRDEMARGQVVAQCHNTSGNMMGEPTQILYLIPECIKLSLLGARI